VAHRVSGRLIDGQDNVGHLVGDECERGERPTPLMADHRQLRGVDGQQDSRSRLKR
jgi:hypothetical protein